MEERVEWSPGKGWKKRVRLKYMSQNNQPPRRQGAKIT
jgi:hypothetical protein